MTFLRKHYAAGTFVVSGRQIPRTGGVIVALGKTRAELAQVPSENQEASQPPSRTVLTRRCRAIGAG